MDKKRNQYYYGHKVHNAVTPTGFIVGGILTPANKSDINNFENVMNELPVLNENIPVLADKGYASATNREYLLKRTLSDKIMHKAVKGKPLTEEQKEENREISKYRYVVEQTFGACNKFCEPVTNFVYFPLTSKLAKYIILLNSIRKMNHKLS